jgi:hypothetical protein
VNLQQIELEIEATRRELGQTLEALHARLLRARRLKVAWGLTRATSLRTLTGGAKWLAAHPALTLTLGAGLLVARVLVRAGRSR